MTFKAFTIVVALTAGSRLMGLDGERPDRDISVSAAAGKVLEIDVVGFGREPLDVSVTITDIDGNRFPLAMPFHPVPAPEGGSGRIHGPIVPERYRGFLVTVEISGVTTGTKLAQLTSGIH